EPIESMGMSDHRDLQWRAAPPPAGVSHADEPACAPARLRVARELLAYSGRRGPAPTPHRDPIAFRLDRVALDDGRTSCVVQPVVRELGDEADTRDVAEQESHLMEALGRCGRAGANVAIEDGKAEANPVHSRLFFKENNQRVRYLTDNEEKRPRKRSGKPSGPWSLSRSTRACGSPSNFTSDGSTSTSRMAC